MQLADHEFLQLAGYPTMKIFEVKTKSADALPPEAVDVAMDIARIADPGTCKALWFKPFAHCSRGTLRSSRK